MSNKSKCGNLECCASSAIDDSITFGWGELDDHGYWEYGCAICARDFENTHPEYGMCWPFSKNSVRNKWLQDLLIKRLRRERKEL